MRIPAAKSFAVITGACLAAMFLVGCSMSLTKYDLQEFPKTVPFFEPISVIYGGDTIQLEANLQRAYTRAVDTLSYPMESCRGVAHIDATVEQDGEPSAWNVGATIVAYSATARSRSRRPSKKTSMSRPSGTARCAPTS